MQIASNISKGGQITSIDMLVTLAKKKEVVVIEKTHFSLLIPADYLLDFSINDILKNSIFFFAPKTNETQNNQL